MTWVGAGMTGRIGWIRGSGEDTMAGWESGLPVSTSTQVKACPSWSRRGDGGGGFD